MQCSYEDSVESRCQIYDVFVCDFCIEKIPFKMVSLYVSSLPLGSCGTEKDIGPIFWDGIGICSLIVLLYVICIGVSVTLSVASIPVSNAVALHDSCCIFDALHI